jgi:hypothetical protein
MQVNEIKFGINKFPSCPFIWYYDQFALKILSSKKYNNIDDLNLNDNVKKSLTKTLLLLVKYDTDFYEINQELIQGTIAIIPDSWESLLCESPSISFHSWYFSKIKKTDIMTSEKFSLKIFTGLFTSENNITPNKDNSNDNNIDTISINTCTQKTISVHNMKLSPKLDNSFIIQFDKLEKNKITFVSVGFCSKIKKACITLHNLTKT